MAASNSGQRRLVHGTRERILSSDHNREQAFEASAIADAFRYLFDANTFEVHAGGVAAMGATLGNPLRAVVLNGLQCRPEIGTFNLFVEPGMAVVVDPGATDDSVAQVIRDPGQLVAGALVIGAGGGGIRIDVIEVSTQQSVIESDNRDIFNQATGTFTPALVNKVVEGRFTYRVRAGTPGAGFPGTAAGWLPLAVASVPSAAASNDDVTFWDVRPLLSDMSRATHLVREEWPRALRQQGSAIDESGAGDWRVRGVFDLELDGAKIGGNLCPTDSGATSLDVSSAGDLQEPGFAAVASKPWYLYAAFPFGLRRWARYSPASSGARLPLSPRGILIFTQKAPAGLSGKAGSAISLPTATGLGSSTTAALAVMAGAFGAGPAWCNSVVSSDGWTVHNLPGILLAAASGNNTSAPVFNLVGNTSYPAHASALRIKFTSTLTIASTTVLSVVRTVIVTDNTGTTTVYTRRHATTEVGPVAGSFLDEFEIDVPLPPNLPSGAAQTLKVGLTYSVGGGAPTYSSQGAYLMGWKLF